MSVLDSPGMRQAPVSVLGHVVSPAAVARFVIAVIVDAVERCSFRAWPHVSEKRAEIAAPFRAHCYPPPAVVPVLRMGCSEASCFGPFPSTHLRRSAFTNRVPVRRRTCNRQFPREAAAASRYAFSYMGQGQLFFLTAVAPEQPKCPPIAIPSAGHRNQAAISFTGNVEGASRHSTLLPHLWSLFKIDGIANGMFRGALK